MGAACSAPTDQHHYITLVVVAMGALSVVKDTSIQHVESLRLLTHINEHLPMLERGVAKERRGKSHDLAAVFLPLMEKHADKVLTHKLLLLWTLEGICGHLIIPEVLSASKEDPVMCPPRVTVVGLKSRIQTCYIQRKGWPSLNTSCSS